MRVQPQIILLMLLEYTDLFCNVFPSCDIKDGKGSPHQACSDLFRLPPATFSPNNCRAAPGQSCDWAEEGWPVDSRSLDRWIICSRWLRGCCGNILGYNWLLPSSGWKTVGREQGENSQPEPGWHPDPEKKGPLQRDGPQIQASSGIETGTTPKIFGMCLLQEEQVQPSKGVPHPLGYAHPSSLWWETYIHIFPWNFFSQPIRFERMGVIL